jgi:hypothetical protein
MAIIETSRKNAKIYASLNPLSCDIISPNPVSSLSESTHPRNPFNPPKSAIKKNPSFEGLHRAPSKTTCLNPGYLLSAQRLVIEQVIHHHQIVDTIIRDILHTSGQYTIARSDLYPRHFFAGKEYSKE